MNLHKFFVLKKETPYGPTDGPMDQLTDKASYTDAWTHPKKKKKKKKRVSNPHVCREFRIQTKNLDEQRSELGLKSVGTSCTYALCSQGKLSLKGNRNRKERFKNTLKELCIYLSFKQI